MIIGFGFIIASFFGMAMLANDFKNPAFWIFVFMFGFGAFLMYAFKNN